MHTHARFPFPKDGRPSCSPLTRQRAHDHTRSTMYPENTTRARPCSGIGASLGARALCALLGRAPLLTSLRARRSDASNAAGPAVEAYGRKPAAHTQPGPASRREAGPTSLRAPRVARTPSPRSALRASLGRLKRSRAGSGSVRQEACGAHAARAGIAARGRPHRAPRSAHRSNAPSAHQRSGHHLAWDRQLFPTATSSRSMRDNSLCVDVFPPTHRDVSLV